MSYVWTDASLRKGKTKIKTEHITELRSAADDLDTRIRAHIGSRGTVHATATQSEAGFLSATDKTALDTHLLSTNDTAHSAATATTSGFFSKDDYNLLHGHVGGRDAAHGLADADHHGFMASTDYTLFHGHIGSKGVAQHALATQTIAGFIDPNDKQFLDYLRTLNIATKPYVDQHFQYYLHTYTQTFNANSFTSNELGVYPIYSATFSISNMEASVGTSLIIYKAITNITGTGHNDYWGTGTWPLRNVTTDPAYLNDPVPRITGDQAVKQLTVNVTLGANIVTRNYSTTGTVTLNTAVIAARADSFVVLNK